MPPHIDGANGTGMGPQTPTPKYGVISPFHAGGGGGGGGGAGAATQVLDGASYTVPRPHSTALLTPGATIVANASPPSAATLTAAGRWILLVIEGLPRIVPDLQYQDLVAFFDSTCSATEGGERCITEIPRSSNQVQQSGVGVWGCPDCLPEGAP